MMHPDGYDCKKDTPKLKRQNPVVISTREEAKVFLTLKKNKAKMGKNKVQSSNEFRSLIYKKAVNKANGKRQRMEIDWISPNPNIKAKAVVIDEQKAKQIEEGADKEVKEDKKLFDLEKMEKEYQKQKEKEKFMEKVLTGRHYLQGYAWMLAEYCNLSYEKTRETAANVTSEDSGDSNAINLLSASLLEDEIRNEVVVSDKVRKLKLGEGISSFVFRLFS